MRLNKYLSESGACSRREADSFIEEGRVTVNGVPAALGTQVEPGDEVKLDGEQIGEARKKSRPVYIALNKPVGITCTTERHVAGNIVDFVDHPERVFPIGRLDKDSEGLILLTNDGDIVNEILRVEHNHEKDYIVGVDRAITPELVAGMAAGVRLSDATTKPCKVVKLGPKMFRITLTQGLNRQIRRMAEAFGYTVEALRRIRIMHVHLGELPLGRWRNLTAEELALLLPQRRADAPRGEARPGGGKPPGNAGQGARPQGGPGRPQTGHPQAGRPQDGQGRPQSGQGRPQGGQGRPQGGHPQGGQGRPQTGHPQAGQGRPQAGRPQAGRPQTGRPQAGRPQAGRPQAGRPQGGGHGGGRHGGGGRGHGGGRGRGAR